MFSSKQGQRVFCAILWNKSHATNKRGSSQLVNQGAFSMLSLLTLQIGRKYFTDLICKDHSARKHLIVLPVPLLMSILLLEWPRHPWQEIYFLVQQSRTAIPSFFTVFWQGRNGNMFKPQAKRFSNSKCCPSHSRSQYISIDKYW